MKYKWMSYIRKYKLYFVAKFIRLIYLYFFTLFRFLFVCNFIYAVIKWFLWMGMKDNGLLILLLLFQTCLNFIIYLPMHNTKPIHNVNGQLLSLLYIALDSISIFKIRRSLRSIWMLNIWVFVTRYLYLDKVYLLWRMPEHLYIILIQRNWLFIGICFYTFLCILNYFW